MPWLDDEQMHEFLDQIKSIDDDLISSINKEKSRFRSFERLLANYNKAKDRLISEGIDAVNFFFEIQNELCLAVNLLENKSENYCQILEYEEPSTFTQKLIDFKATLKSGYSYYLEVKSIHPTLQDDWAKYKKALKEDRFKENTSLVLEEDFLGGMLYHHKVAVRSKMLEYSLDFEAKIAESNLVDGVTILVFFSNGFHWNEDELYKRAYIILH